MEINHINGGSVDTNNSNDVDAILMEESAKLHKLFAKYNRQLLLIGEMKASVEMSSDTGCSFFHISTEDNENLNKNYSRFMKRLDGYVRTFTNDQLFIAKNPPTNPSSET